MIYNEIIQGNDFSKNLISFESEKYILFDCEIYSEFLYLHKRLRNTEYTNRIRDRKIAIKIRWNKNRMKWTFSPSRAQSLTQFGLCRGEKTKNEIQRFRQAERRAEHSSSYAEAGKRRRKFNHFVKPSAIEFTRIAEARNGAWKWTFSLSQMSRAALARAMPWRENDCWKQTNVFIKPSAEPNLFRLCRGEKTKNEIQRFR